MVRRLFHDLNETKSANKSEKKIYLWCCSPSRFSLFCPSATSMDPFSLWLRPPWTCLDVHLLRTCGSRTRTKRKKKYPPTVPVYQYPEATQFHKLLVSVFLHPGWSLHHQVGYLRVNKQQKVYLPNNSVLAWNFLSSELKLMRKQSHQTENILRSKHHHGGHLSRTSDQEPDLGHVFMHFFFLWQTYVEKEKKLWQQLMFYCCWY